MTGIRSIVVLVLCLGVVPASARAQGAAAPPPPPPAREATAEFSFIGTTGNTSTASLGLGGEVIFRPDTWVVRNRAAFVSNETDGELSAQSLLDVFRAEKVLSPRLSVFGQYGYFRDRFAGIEHRNDVLGGVAFTVVNVPKHKLVVDGGFGYLNESRTEGDDVSSGTFGSGAAYKWSLSDTAEVTEDIRFMGVFADASDWRLDQRLAVTARLTGIFSLKVSNTIRYLHLPPIGFETTDTVTAVALVAKF